MSEIIGLFETKFTYYLRPVVLPERTLKGSYISAIKSLSYSLTAYLCKC